MTLVITSGSVELKALEVLDDSLGKFNTARLVLALAPTFRDQTARETYKLLSPKQLKCQMAGCPFQLICAPEQRLYSSIGSLQKWSVHSYHTCISLGSTEPIAFTRDLRH